MAITSRRSVLTATGLISCFATAKFISFIPRSHVAFAPQSSQLYKIPRINGVHPFLFRGGEIDESFEINESTVDGDKNGHDNQDIIDEEVEPINADKINPHQEEDTNNADIKQIKNSASEKVWDEEIKRLQMYLKSPHSRRRSDARNLQTGENSDAYGAGEDILVLGNRAVGNGGADAVENEGSVRSSIHSDEDESYNEQADTSELGLENDVADTNNNLSIEDDKKGSEINEDETNVETHSNSGDFCGDEAPDSGLPDTEATIAAEETVDTDIHDTIDAKVTPNDNDTIEEMVHDNATYQKEPQIITELSSNILLEADSDVGEDTETYITTDQSITISNQWTPIPTISESNKLVEEGLRKLRRKDGDHPSVPYVITRAMKQVLIDELGYDEAEVQAMRPDVAVVVVSENLKRPSIEILPSRFYQEDAEVVDRSALQSDGFKAKFERFIQRIDLKRSIFMLGSMVLSSLLLSVFRSTKCDQIIPENDETVSEVTNIDGINKREGSEDVDANTDTETKVEVLPQRDLDRNWLERLISMITGALS